MTTPKRTYGRAQTCVHACGRCGGKTWAMTVNFLYGWLCSRCNWILNHQE